VSIGIPNSGENHQEKIQFRERQPMLLLPLRHPRRSPNTTAKPKELGARWSD
jgi:hypothetical protein